MTQSQRWREYQRLNRRLVKHSKGKRSHIKIDVVPMLEALTDWRFGPGACQFVAQSLETALGKTDDRLTCFCCCRDWDVHRGPIGCLIVEFIGLPPDRQGRDAGLLSGICGECMDKGQPEIMKAVRRDFPYMDRYRFVSREGHA